MTRDHRRPEGFAELRRRVREMEKISGALVDELRRRDKEREYRRDQKVSLSSESVTKLRGKFSNGESETVAESQMPRE